MTEDKQEKINILIKFLKRKPKEGKPMRIGGLLFDNEDILNKYRALDKHIKLVAECIHKRIISYDFFCKFEGIRVRNYDDKSKLNLYVLFSNSAKFVLFFSSHKYRELGNYYSASFHYEKVGEWFFNKFDFIGENGQEVDINNKEIVQSPFIPKSESFSWGF